MEENDCTCYTVLHIIILIIYKLTLNLVKLLIAWKSVDCPTVSLHEVFLKIIMLLKFKLDHAQRVFLVIL